MSSKIWPGRGTLAYAAFHREIVLFATIARGDISSKHFPWARPRKNVIIWNVGKFAELNRPYLKTGIPTVPQNRDPEAGFGKYRKNQIVVIGAGITGLVAAYRLLRSGFSVVLLESTLQLGGMAASFHLGDKPLEYLYHHIFTSDRYLIDLAEELGIDHELAWYSSREALYINERLYPFVTPLDLVRFREIPFSQRIRTGLTVLHAAGLTEWKAFESCTAAEWLSRQGGRQAYEKIWQPSFLQI